MAFNRVENTFIIGAGASKELGFSLGGEMKDNVAQALTDKQSQFFNLILKCGETLGYSADDLEWYTSELSKQKEDPTLDTFVGSYIDSERKNIIETITKACIAADIIRCENPTELMDSPGWYEKLFDKLYDGRNTYQAFLENKIRLITFNFDRSLEFYLYKKILDRWPEHEETLANDLTNSNLKVIHLHGSLGELLDENSSSYKEYTNDWQDPAAVTKATKSIKLHTDEDDTFNLEAFETAKQQLKNADLVHYIGFGFHPDNLSRLRAYDETRKRANHTFGTIYKLSPAQLIPELAVSIGLQVTSYLPSTFEGAEIDYRLAQAVTSNTSISEYLDIAPLDGPPPRP